MGARLTWLWRHRAQFIEGTRATQPRVLVDVSTIIRHDAQTGIQRVVRSVWAELKRRDGAGFDVLPIFASQTHGYCIAPADFLDEAFVEGARRSLRVRPGDKFIGLDLSAHVLPKYRQQLRTWRAHGVTVHLFVYDLLPVLRPQWFSTRASANFREWLKIVAQECDQAICISKQVARDLRDFLHDVGNGAGRSAPLIAIIRLGGDLSRSRPTTGMRLENTQLLDKLRFRRAILMVGTIEPRKGHDVALAAFEDLWEKHGNDAPDLVIVGKAGWKTASLQRRLRNHPENGRRLHWLENVSDEALSKIYQACRGLLVASFAEGFGLTLAEALMHGRPVLARDLPVFRDQHLPNIVYFEDDRPEPLGAALLKLARAEAIAPTGRNELPTWETCVDELLTAIGLPEVQPAVSPPSALAR